MTDRTIVRYAGADMLPILIILRFPFVVIHDITSAVPPGSIGKVNRCGRTT